MPRVNILGGSQVARSPIANYQRCVNLYPEENGPGAPTKFTLYPRPGLRQVASSGTTGKPWRGFYTNSEGVQFGVCGSAVFRINADWTLTDIGTLVNTARVTPVSFSDNRTETVLVDGSLQGYYINSSGALTQIDDPTGSFVGADKVDYIDTYLVFNNANTNEFISTLSNVLTFDPTYIAALTSNPFNLVTLVVNHRTILLLGTYRTEIWYDAGNTGFPFAEFPGLLVEQGCVGIYTVACQDQTVCWIAKNLLGQGIVVKFTPYTCTRISDHNIEFMLREAVKNGEDLSQVISYMHQQDGHVWYVMTLPITSQTWACDLSTGNAWSQRAYTDETTGALTRERANCFGMLNGLPCVGDWSNGNIYVLDPDVYSDNGQPIQFIRGFPHIAELPNAKGQLVETNGRLVTIRRFMVDFETGEAPDDTVMLSLRYSIDKGRTFSETLMTPAGGPGQFLTQPTWQTEAQGRDLVFELAWNYPGPGALNGAWVDGEVMEEN